MNRAETDPSLARTHITVEALLDRDVWREALKSVFDRVVAGLGLVVLAPVFAVIAVAIRLDSPGPAIFRQRRAGRYGQEFIMYKFRSMRQSSDHDLHRAAFQRFFEARSCAEAGVTSFKPANDPRVTRVGRFLRVSSLDELPQLVNVVKGEMSLVGPRPCLPYELEMYQERHRARLAVQPGITGLWQVRGRCEVPFEEMVALDLDYIAHRSFLIDLKIIFLTFSAVLRGRGAG